MPVIDEIKDQKKKVKDLPLKKKISYFWDYYKLPTIAIMIAVLFVIFFTRDVIRNSREEMLDGVIINASSVFDGEEQAKAFAAYAGIDLDKYQVIIDSSLVYDTSSLDETDTASLVKIMGLSQVEKLDFIITDETNFQYFCENGYFLPLDSVSDGVLLSDDTYSIFYSEATDASDSGAYGVYLSGSQLISESSSEEPMVLGFVTNGPHPEMTLEFLNYLLSN